MFVGEVGIAMKLDYIDEGIRKDDTEHYIFDYSNDLGDDIIFLCKNTSGVKTKGNLTYYYGYEFNPKATRKQQEDFRNNIKHKFHDSDVFYSEDADRFVRDGIYRMDELKSLSDFGVAISTASFYGEKTLTGLMCQICWDEMPDKVPCCNLQLIKKMCKDVTFDEERAREALMRTDKYRTKKDADNAIKNLKNQFEIEKKRGGLFKIKLYKPVIGRSGFIDFLKFPSKSHQKLYETLKAGTEVLVCEDFITSGSTVNEIIRFLNSINPNNKISVFVLINQMRDY